MPSESAMTHGSYAVCTGYISVIRFHIWIHSYIHPGIHCFRLMMCVEAEGISNCWIKCWINMCRAYFLRSIYLIHEYCQNVLKGPRFYKTKYPFLRFQLHKNTFSWFSNRGVKIERTLPFGPLTLKYSIPEVPKILETTKQSAYLSLSSSNGRTCHINAHKDIRFSVSLIVVLVL